MDPLKLLPLCVSIQRYYQQIKAKTQVLVASLTSVGEIYDLAGVDHITIAPGLLRQLSMPIAAPMTESLFDSESTARLGPTAPYANRESAYRLVFTRADRGLGEEKLTQVCPCSV